MNPNRKPPIVLADEPLPLSVKRPLEGVVEWLPWDEVDSGQAADVEAIYTYGHPRVDGQLLDRLPGVRVISNFGVGVDHISLADAAARGVRVGHTPGVVDGATADMGFTLLLAAARGLIRGDHYARGPEFTHYDPSYLIGREIHGQRIGIVGMGRIGYQIAQRATGFAMEISYHNRRPRTDLPEAFAARYVSLDELLAESDFVVVTVPLTDQTRGMIGREEIAKMRSTAILVNIARGGVVDTDALTEALIGRRIYAAGLDVTDPEPLPRDHPLLSCDNLTIAPHLGSATEQTRKAMADASIENLLRGLKGQSLLFEAK